MDFLSYLENRTFCMHAQPKNEPKTGKNQTKNG